MGAAINKLTIQDDRSIEVEALLSSIGDGVIVTDSSARISRINQAALDILGYDEEEIIGRWYPKIVLASDERGNLMSNSERPMALAFLTGKTISARSYYNRKDGTKVPINLTVSPVMLGSKPMGAIEVFRDITREIELERAKDEFVAIASHQLRTPATAVKQYIGLLLEGYTEPLTDSQKMFLERAYESNERQLQIVHEILKITQLDLQKIAFKPEDSDIGNVAKRAAATIKSNFEKKNQKIVIELPKKPVLARVDKEQLQVAIENLLENASNYTKSGKTITLSAKQAKSEAKIMIKDQGVGIARQDFPKLFQKFSRIPNPLSVESGGTGLGLYWASKIIQMHKGRIDVESILGRGTTFTISLPAE